MNLLINAPFWFFIICFIGAVFTWFAADHFREQILGDNHRLVREVALRYLQVIVGFFAVFIIGIILAIGTIFNRFFNSDTPGETLPAESGLVITQNINLSTGDDRTSTPEPDFIVSTIDAPMTQPPPPADTELSTVRSAVIFNTNGLGVNAREVPGLGGAVLGVISEGVVVTLLDGVEIADGYTWYQVILPDGQVGWVADIFLAFRDQ